MAQNQVISRSMYLISNMYPSDDNPGYGVFVKNVQEGLSKCGYQTKYMSVIKGKGKSKIDKVRKYLCFSLSIIFSYFKKYDLLYVHYPTHSSPILLLLMKIRRRKLVINFHGEDLIYNKKSYVSLLGKAAETLTREFASLVVVPSEYYKGVVLAKELVPEHKIVVSPSGGIDSTLFKVEPRVQSDKLVLGFVGRLQEDKGVLDYINACKKLSKTKKIKAFIIGYGPLDETVKQLVGDDLSFEYISGVNQRDLPKYYRTFDLFCFPSKRNTESLGLVGIEAMACGTPIIGTEIGGIPSYLKDKMNGFLISVSDIENGIIKSVEEYHSFNDKEKFMMFDNAVQTSKRYDRDVVCRKLSEVFECI